jgi:Ca-activated chloride channel family protein
MRSWFPVLCAALLWAGPVGANGLLVPADKSVPPLAMVEHHVGIAVEDQVAVTRVEQTFHNHTDKQLEATYLFPVPHGASVNKFTMWVDGKEVKGEMVEAKQANQVYTDIVRRLQDPGLLEYVGANLLRLRIFPVPANGDQKVSLSYTSINPSDAGLTEYVYPLKSTSDLTRSPVKFKLDATFHSQHRLLSVYSPSHAVKIKHKNDNEATVSFEASELAADKDFQLFYGLGDRDVGLTALCYRPDADKDGCFLLLVAPRAELSRSQQVPRDVVLVLDTSGSMAGPKMEQAKKALKYCLDNLADVDRFALLNFATTVNKYSDKLEPVGSRKIEQAKRWVDDLQATGGTAINDALNAALDFRSDSSRSFTVVFFTDGQPTVGETDPEKILKNVEVKNTASTRIFTFGVGDDVNAVLLDRLADQTRAVSTYVRPHEDLEVKTSSLFDKISHPVLSDLKLSVGSGITLSEIYPNKLPDLFHGGQLVVLGRYRGHGHAALTLTGTVGSDSREFVFDANFPEKTGDDKSFVADLWARRKVGYLLDQIRVNGEKKELVDEVIALAKKHGITTPYTSYLVVPDVAPRLTTQVPVPTMPPQSAPGYFGTAPVNSTGSTHGMATAPPATAIPPGSPAYIQYSPQMQWAVPNAAAQVQPPSPTRFMDGFNAGVPLVGADGPSPSPAQAGSFTSDLNKAGRPAAPAADASFHVALERGVAGPPVAQTGKEGVDLSLALQGLRNQEQVAHSTAKQAAGRNCVAVNGVWVDDGYDAKMPTLKVKAQSAAYFRILERQPKMKDVLRLGNRLVWVTPSGTALVIDPSDGKETLGDDEIDRLFAAK